MIEQGGGGKIINAASSAAHTSHAVLGTYGSSKFYSVFGNCARRAAFGFGWSPWGRASSIRRIRARSRTTASRPIAEAVVVAHCPAPSVE